MPQTVVLILLNGILTFISFVSGTVLSQNDRMQAVRGPSPGVKVSHNTMCLNMHIVLRQYQTAQRCILGYHFVSGVGL